MGDALAAKLPMVQGVKEHLDHALLNLLLNALEAIGQQEGTIRIRAAAREDSVERAL